MARCRLLGARVSRRRLVTRRSGSGAGQAVRCQPNDGRRNPDLPLPAIYSILSVDVAFRLYRCRNRQHGSTTSLGRSAERRIRCDPPLECVQEGGRSTPQNELTRAKSLSQLRGPGQLGTQGMGRRIQATRRDETDYQGATRLRKRSDASVCSVSTGNRRRSKARLLRPSSSEPRARFPAEAPRFRDATFALCLPTRSSSS